MKESEGILEKVVEALVLECSVFTGSLKKKKLAWAELNDCHVQALAAASLLQSNIVLSVKSVLSFLDFNIGIWKIQRMNEEQLSVLVSFFPCAL